MARPTKQGLEYFPLDVDFLDDIKIRKIIKACGLNAIPILIRLLGNIYKDEGYYIGWDEDLPFVIADSVGVTEGAVEEVIKKAVQVGFFDAVLFHNHHILTSEGIQKRFFSATSRRECVNIVEKYIIKHPKKTVKKELIHTETPVSAYKNPGYCIQKVHKSKVKNREYISSLRSDIILQEKENINSSLCSEFIEKKIEEKPKNFKPPTLHEVSDYIAQKNYQINPERFIAFYESKGWMIGKSKMKNWKAALSTWNLKSREDKNRGAPQIEPQSKMQENINLIKKFANECNTSNR